MTKKLLALILIMLTSAPVIAMSDTPAISFTQAWVQEGPPNARVLAGFMQINNNSKQDINILSATSKTFKKVEFHRTVQDKGMARMQQQDQLTIPASGQLRLEHGSYHLMLIEPAKKLKAGDTITIEFTLQDNKKQSVTLDVRLPEQGQGHSHHHHH